MQSQVQNDLLSIAYGRCSLTSYPMYKYYTCSCVQQCSSQNTAVVMQQIQHGYSLAQENHGSFNILNRYFSKCQLCHYGWFSQISGHKILNSCLVHSHVDDTYDLCLHIVHRILYFVVNSLMINFAPSHVYYLVD